MTVGDDPRLNPFAAHGAAWSKPGPGEAAQSNGHDPAGLAALLDIHAWAALDIPPEPKLLGDLITPSTRMFVVGRTGLGKTLFLHAMAAGMASGQGFLHWRSAGPSRWLILDGEMPSALIKARAEDTIRRTEIPPGNLVIYSLDRAEEFARLIPGLGVLAPINTEAGQQFVLRLAEAVRAEGIGFDNVMSLVAGDQREETPWTETLPLVAELSKRRIAQIYLDHTGHNSDRQYGSAVKAWRMDAVGMMTPLPDTQRDREVAFSLSFEPPGKARRRTPDNWDDFAPCTIRLQEDQWTSEVTKPVGKLTQACRLWHSALLDALSRPSDTPGRTTRAMWFAEAARTGLVEAIADGETRSQRERKHARLRKYSTELRIAGLIGIDGETVTLIEEVET
jgi:hypothetical protein